MRRVETFVIGSGNAPCHHCADRHEGCHSVCERYREFRAERDREAKERESRRKSLIPHYKKGQP